MSKGSSKPSKFEVKFGPKLHSLAYILKKEVQFAEIQYRNSKNYKRTIFVVDRQKLQVDSQNLDVEGLVDPHIFHVHGELCVSKHGLTCTLQ